MEIGRTDICPILELKTDTEEPTLDSRIYSTAIARALDADGAFQRTTSEMGTYLWVEK